MNVRFTVSARRHDVSLRDAAAALAGAVVTVTALDGEDDKWLALGFDTAGRLLELVGYDLDGGAVLVVHAMKCRASYYRLITGGDSK
ncbi:MAG: hypothetical protein LBC97_13330 [Bifidobacteriaceae bacterium]|nr:hypothetical protein [Bifidobacteriaceae bacterium]